MLSRGVLFNDGCLEVKRSGERLIVAGENFSVELSPRVVLVKGARSVEVKEVYGSRGKVVYIHHQAVSALKKCEGATDEVDFGDYIVRSTRLYTGSYTTIITPGYSLVNYVVVTKDSTVIVLQGKREVYFEENEHVAVYVV